LAAFQNIARKLVEGCSEITDLGRSVIALEIGKLVNTKHFLLVHKILNCNRQMMIDLLSIIWLLLSFHFHFFSFSGDALNNNVPENSRAMHAPRPMRTSAAKTLLPTH